MDDDDSAGLDLRPLPRIPEKHRQRAAQRDEDLLLIRVEVAAAAGVGRLAPHPRPRLGHVRRLRQRGGVAGLLALVSRPLLPVEIGVMDDVPGHGATIPSAPMAEPRPAALPPAERTIGQLVAESIQFYGAHFWACLVLGVAPAAIAVAFTQVSHRTALVLAPTLSSALISATFVYASTLVLEASPPRRILVVAWLIGWLVFAPVPFLVLAFIVPGLLWVSALGLVVPVVVTEDVPPRAALSRA